jgi:hypothetical protein
MLPQELPNIGGMAAKMSAQHARVVDAATALSGRIDELVAATGRHDWTEVGRISRELASESRSSGHRVVSGLAERISEEAQRQNELGVKRSLIRLIGTHGRTSRQLAQ